MTYALRLIPEEERPRERLQSAGAEALASSELLAIVLGSGVQGKSVLELAQELLSRFGGLRALSDASVSELCAVRGLGPAKAVQLKAALTLGVRLSRATAPPRAKLNHPLHVWQLLREELEHAAQERFVVLLLDAKGGLVRSETVSVGTLSETLVHPREVFAPAVRHSASSILVAHNHPSGDPEPSRADLALTRQLCRAGDLMEIPVQDHVILGHGRYISLRESRRLPDCW